MESVQTSLFQRFGTEFEQVARHWTGKPVPVNSNVNQDSGEDPATSASKPSCPVLTPCIHTVGSRPSVTANRRADKARPSLHGPARSHVESISATSSHLKDRTSLTDPTTAAGSHRPPASTTHPRPLVGTCFTPSPKPRQRRLPSPRSHGPSGTGIPAEADPIPGIGHDLITEGFHCVGIGSDSLPTGPLQWQPGTLPTPGRTPLPVLLDSPDSPI